MKSLLRVLMLLAVIALIAVVIPVSVSATDLPPGGTFVDDDELLEEGWIEAIAAIRVTRGCNPPANDRFCPHDTVIRAQMASFLVRALNLPPTTEDYFVDDEGSVHEGDINALFEAGITRGCNPPDNDRFCPTSRTTRGQMAAFLNRAFHYPDSGGVDYFTDDGDTVFEDDINRIAAAGITAGCAAGRYCPGSPMLRRHMAVFLGRSLELTPDTPPARPHVIGEFTTYHSACSYPCRVTNIHLIADAVDGAVVQPGETWSLNAHVGERTEAKGYVEAGAIIGGVVIGGGHPANIGGGTSQFATTLYNAVFFAGLEDVYHRPHSIYFSRYPMGREATLSWPGPDVKFRNDTDLPLTIDTSHTSTSVTVELIGANEGRRVRAYLSGSASTADGGDVTVTRVITFRDDTTETERWYHHYNPLKTEDMAERIN